MARRQIGTILPHYSAFDRYGGEQFKKLCSRGMESWNALDSVLLLGSSLHSDTLYDTFFSFFDE